MNDLFYFEDSGALNEAFSDILGESIDILNGDSSAEPRKYVNCSFSSSERWLMGEDTSYGAIRDMNTPECFGDPSSLRNPLYAFHWCFDYMDGYGVHTNSGVMNKIFSVMTDGGFQIQYSKRMGFQNVVYSQGISLEKALNVVGMGYSYLNQFSNYQDAAVAIEESCEDLLTAAPFVPVINRRSVKASKPLVAYMCNRVRTIMKRANLYDDPIDDDVCDFLMGPS